MQIRATNLIVCRAVYTDQYNCQSLGVIGSVFGTDTFPAALPHFAVYVGFEGDTRGAVIETRITRDESLDSIASRIVRSADHPIHYFRGTTSVEAMFDDVVFQEEGTYRVRVFVNGQHLISRRLHLVRISAPIEPVPPPIP